MLPSHVGSYIKQMLILALDTSSYIGSMALLRNDSVLTEQSVGGRMEHAAQLFPKLEQMLSESGTRMGDIDLYAVGIGPGSFNGIRIGIAAFKGMQLATKKPMVGVSSADALAYDALTRCPTECFQIAVITDARRGEWYFSLYKGSGDGAARIGGDSTVAPEIIPTLIHEPTFFVGPNNAVLHERFASLKWNVRVRFEEQAAIPRAVVIGQLGSKKVLAQGGGDANVEPIYLRQPVLTPPNR